MTPAVFVTLTVASLGLALFSQTWAWYGDEGFHVLAARLLLAGKLPYRDFFYQHPPTYVLLCAAWMKAFGSSWRSTHALSTVCIVGCLYLTGRLVFRHVESSWRAPAASLAIVLGAVQAPVVLFATIAQPYALCLFSGMASVTAASVRAGRRIFWSGLWAGIAASSSLLMLPALCVTLVWIWNGAEPDRRFSSAGRFIGGAAVAFVPFFVLAALAPRAALFDVFEFSLRYRNTAAISSTVTPSLAVFRDQAGAVREAFGSLQAMLLLVLVGVGLWSLRARSTADRDSVFSVCAWIAAVGSACFLVPHPTFPQYFTLVVPAFAAVASAGAAAFRSDLASRAPSWWLMTPVVLVCALGLGRTLHERRALNYSYWSETRDVMRLADQVTPPGGLLYAENETFYAASQHAPPAGLENTYASNNGVPSATRALAHISSLDEIDQWLGAGRFATLVLFEDDERIDRMALRTMYRQSRSLGVHQGGYLVLWDRASR